MLEVQKFLMRGYDNKTLEDLNKLLGIEVRQHPTLPLVLLNYDMLNSPKTHPIVMECRGLCLELDTWKIVSMGFKRFFNYGEAPAVNDAFDWTDFETFEKMDGSYIGITSYNSELLIHTRGSFAQLEINGCGRTWRDVVLGCLTEEQKEFIRTRDGFSFIFELVGPYNPVVKVYPEPKLYLLTITENGSSEVLTWGLDAVAEKYGFNRPQIFKFDSISAILRHLDSLADEKSSDEGFVLRDKHGLRIKVKNKWYLNLHHLHNNGNICSTKVLLDVVMKGEEDEISSYFPYIKDHLKKIKKKVDDTYKGIATIWWKGLDITERKKFAFYIKDNGGPWASIHFKMRDQYGTDTTFDGLWKVFKEHQDLIYKVLFKDKEL